MSPIDVDADRVAAAAADEAIALRAAGLGAGDSIGWLGLNGLRGLALLEACRAVGARFVPLNWRLAPAELATIAAHANLQRLWHDDALTALAAEVAALVPLPQPRADDHQPGDLMLVYTSGTTGLPKGAVHTAAGMAANVEAAIDAQALDAATRTLAVLPLFHVGGLCIQVRPTLAAGGVVRLHPRFDPGAWLHEVRRWRPTTSLLVPAVMRALIEHPDWAGADLSSLQFVAAGSQIVPPTLIEAFHARGVPVVQVYGSTETGPVSVVLRRQDALAQVGRVGRPARGVRLKLAADGEICLQAPNLLRSYHRGVPRAFDADGWFHTGDLARELADGVLEVVGRSSELIISGGENIHPAEIENLLAGHPDVADAAVVGLPDARWGEVPVLVLVPRSGHAIDAGALQALFDARLARYKHPRRIVVVEALPKTALGKVARAALVRALGDGA
ncbi:MAG: AMP-binding protein [Rubrivivax sp.]